jgi:hypothetical protein
VPITPNEAALVVAQITPIFGQILAEYDFGKYPSADYIRFKVSFSALQNPNPDIADAMVWKWGHWGKPNYPRHHRDLIAEIQGLWPQFVGSGSGQTSSQTFQWWSDQLARPTTYITVAYISHLVHHNEPLPIIDQHNFRAMNSLLSGIRQNHQMKKKPSSWTDIVELKQFMASIQVGLPQRNFDEIDRFLMMYGKNHAAR